MAQERLNVVPTDERQSFTTADEAIFPLRNVFTGLSIIHLTTIDQIMVSKMNGGDLFSLNCQSFRTHVRDLRGNIVLKAHILMLSEKWLRSEEIVEIENFKCITQYRRNFVRRNIQYANQTKSNLGDICAARSTSPNGEPIVVVTVYSSANQSFTGIIDYILETYY
ncbi:hypothetical protein TNCV_3421521 [Trichonephila clavipes]|nr:hypothetical protein TNCV_3421521 [Trichonephila clavipes]